VCACLFIAGPKQLSFNFLIFMHIEQLVRQHRWGVDSHTLGSTGGGSCPHFRQLFRLEAALRIVMVSAHAPDSFAVSRQHG